MSAKCAEAAAVAPPPSGLFRAVPASDSRCAGAATLSHLVMNGSSSRRPTDLVGRLEAESRCTQTTDAALSSAN